MRPILAKNWWSLVIRGIAGVLLGVVTFVWPGITLGALILLFGAFALVDGAGSIVGAVRASRKDERWGSLLIVGVAGIAAGLVAFLWPGLTALALVYVIAAWAIVAGIFEIAAAVRLRKHIEHEWLLALTGILSVAFGVLIAVAPLAGALVIALWVGAYAFVYGVLLIALGFRLRKSPPRTLGAGGQIPVPQH
jgi:uncharacterized membrane protein HdeD (DUF308 family)